MVPGMQEKGKTLKNKINRNGTAYLGNRISEFPLRHTNFEILPSPVPIPATKQCASSAENTYGAFLTRARTVQSLQT